MSRYSLNIEITEDVYNKLHEKFFDSDFWGKIPKGGKFEFVYGFDHITAWFCQFYGLDDNGKDEVTSICGFEDECINLDYMFDKLMHYDLGNLIAMFDGNPKHIENCFFDLSF